MKSFSSKGYLIGKLEAKENEDYNQYFSVTSALKVTKDRVIGYIKDSPTDLMYAIQDCHSIPFPSDAKKKTTGNKQNGKNHMRV